MRCLCLCLLFVCCNVFGKSLTIKDWLLYFENNNIQIFYSSDYLPKETQNKLLELDADSIEAFDQALESLALTVIKADTDVFVINPIKHKNTPTTGLIIKLLDIENNTSIKTFSIDSHLNDHNQDSSRKGVVLLQNFKAQQLQLNISADDYFPLSVTVDVVADQYKTLTFALEPLPVRIDKIIVTASQVNFNSPNSSKKTFLRADIENAVSFNNDPIRASERVPGNTSTGISGKTKTRGGNDNESLIVLDNHVLRNPFHFKNFFSLFSTINQSYVDSLDFYSGIFPIQYGGRLSSVLSIQTDDNITAEKHEIGADLLNAYYTYRQSSADYSKQYMASIRTGGQLINDHLIRDNIIRPEFDDAYFKATQELSNNWQSSQHLLVSRDEIKIDDLEEDPDKEPFGEIAAAGHHDQDLWLQWNYDNHRNSYAHFQIYASRKHDSRVGNVTDENSSASLIEDTLTTYMGLKYSQTINLKDRFSISFGTNIFSEETSIKSSRNINHFGELITQLGLQSQTQRDFEFENQGSGVDAFINARYQISKKIIFDLGFRYEYKQWIDENITSPRFNLSYFYNDTTTYRIAIGRHQQSQYIDELLLEDENPSYFKPASADIAIFELNKEFSPNLSLRAEVYYKKYSSTQPYYENLFNGFHVLPELFFDRIRVSPDDSKATGAEFTLNGSNDKFQWSASYIFSDVDDVIDDIETPRSWDQHNALKFNVHMPIRSKYLNDWFNNWQFDFTANYRNGWAKTDIITTENDLHIGARNNSTFDDFYQFDVKFSKQYNTQHGKLKLAIQVNNLLNTQNPCCIDYRLDDGELESKEKSWLPLTPNISVIYKWD